MPYTGNYLGVNNRNGSLRQFAARECDERKGRGSDHRDMLRALMDVKEQKPGEFDDNGVLSMAASNIFAGSDTTGISIGAVLYNLCKLERSRMPYNTRVLVGRRTCRSKLAMPCLTSRLAFMRH
jgi:hypothetical protein